jgi:anti-sigma factor RsiW
VSQTSSLHIAIDRLADFVEGGLNPAGRARVAAHIAECDRCSAHAASLSSLIETMRTDDTQPAPAHVINRAIRAYRTERLSGKAPAGAAGGGLRRRLVAALRFDSAWQPYALGQRSGHTSERELLYDAGESTVEVRVDRGQAGWTVGGQVLGACGGGGQALLESPSASAAGSLNEFCEFSLPPVQDGIYLLILRLDDVDVEVPGLEFRA